MTTERQRYRHSSACKACDLESKSVLFKSLDNRKIGALARGPCRFTDRNIAIGDLSQVIRLWLKAWKPRPRNQEITTYRERKGIDKRGEGSTYCTGNAEYHETPPPKFDQDRPQRG